MGSGLRMLFAFCLAAVLLGSEQDQNPRRATSLNAPESCGIIREAIEEFGKIRPGMTRREIEKHFNRDGGIQVRNATRYSYSKCKEATIKVEIKFKLAGPVDQTPFSKDDTVVEVSKPYLEYFTQD
jgi:hypothetical protein